MKLLCAPLLLLCSSAQGALLYEAFNEPFEQVRQSLPALREQGFTHVVISPPQKSLARGEWWARYQPVDYSRIEGPLGDEESLALLFETGRQENVKIIVDTVLNHMANDIDFPDLRFPQFGPEDFHYPDSRLCIDDFSVRFQAMNRWLCDFRARLPDLRTESEKVRAVQLSYLRRLVSMGAAGFRFDAAVNVEAETFAYFRSQLPPDLFYFGEVVGTSCEEVGEYLPLMRVTDFWLLRRLLEVMGTGGDASQLLPAALAQASLGHEQIPFTRTHDGLFHSDFFNFRDARSLSLAYAALLTSGLPNGYLLNVDREHEFVPQSLRFRREVSHLTPATISVDASLSRRVAAWSLGGQGIAIFNLSNDWVALESLQGDPNLSGCFRELIWGFVACWEEGRIARWEGGVASIGPRTPLLFVSNDG